MKRLTAKQLLKEVREIKKQAGNNPCAPELIEYEKEEDLRSLIEESIGPDGLMYGWGDVNITSIDVKDGVAYFDGNISGQIPARRVCWYLKRGNPQVRKAFKELEKELNSFIKKNNRMLAGAYTYFNDRLSVLGFVTGDQKYHITFHLEGFGDAAEIIEKGQGSRLLFKNLYRWYDCDIDKDVPMAVSNMKKFINNKLLDYISE